MGRPAQREYSRLKEQIFSKENLEKIATLQSNYESEKKQREIELLKKEGAIEAIKSQVKGVAGGGGWPLGLRPLDPT